MRRSPNRSEGQRLSYVPGRLIMRLQISNWEMLDDAGHEFIPWMTAA